MVDSFYLCRPGKVKRHFAVLCGHVPNAACVSLSIVMDIYMNSVNERLAFSPTFCARSSSGQLCDRFDESLLKGKVSDLIHHDMLMQTCILELTR